jgi:hypothetical protein
MLPNLPLLNFLVCLAATLFMTGVIWAVQLALYPLFAEVGADGWHRYHAAHTIRISRVVVAPMLLELGSALMLVLFRPAGVPSWAVWLGLLLLGVIWATTFFVSVPYHNQLETATGTTRAAAVTGLVVTNWIRTAAWTGRSLLLLGVLLQLIQRN